MITWCGKWIKRQFGKLNAILLNLIMSYFWKHKLFICYLIKIDIGLEIKKIISGRYLFNNRGHVMHHKQIMGIIF